MLWSKQRIMFSILCGILISLFMFRFVHGDEDTRSNVVFVIDDTISMAQEIEQVKENVQEIFKAVLKSNKSNIGNFILITFNDYEVPREDDPGEYEDNVDLETVLLRTTTRDPVEFLNKLNEIEVGGGGYCSELSLAGVKFAIEKSNPYSYIYVFTDASAKDYEELNSVKAMATKKSIQITFLLTGDCDDSVFPEYTVYKKIADATSGEVFNVKKEDITEIMNYIKKSIDNPKTTLVSEPINPGVNKINFTVDNDMKNVTVSVNVNRDTKVNLNVTDPHGNEVPTEDLVNIGSSKVSTILNPENGTYVATVDSESKGKCVVKAAVNVNFHYGFSGIIPNSIKNTRTRPVPDMKSHLAIKLDILNDDTDVKVTKILILDMSDKELMDIPGDVINDTSKFYVSVPFEPPKNTFKVAIVAVDQKTGENYKRIARTPVEPQTYAEKVTYKRPKVIIESGPSIKIQYGNPLTLECRVIAYPQPKIVWEDKESGTMLNSTASIIELPYDYLSILNIDNVTKTNSYKCKVSIHDDIAEDSIEVETFRPRFWNILEKPTDTNIDYEKDGKVFCKIDAWPLASINWFKDDKQLINDDQFSISDDKKTLLVKKMLPELEGNFSCKASNDEKSATLNFTLTLSGVDRPKIDKETTKITVNEGEEANIPCRIIGGLPTPVITWKFEGKTKNKVQVLSENSQEIHIPIVGMQNAGVYKCQANNLLGDDFHEITLNVQTAPEIDKSNTNITRNQGSQVVILCRIKKGSPGPDVTWEFKRKDTSEFLTIPKTEQELNIKSVELNNAGVYRCKVKNVVGEDTHEIVMTVQSSPVIDKQKSKRSVAVGSKTHIDCRIKSGIPNPVITWKFKREKASEFVDLLNTEQKIRIDPVDFDNAGVYKCRAVNIVGYDFHRIVLTVENEPVVVVEQPESMKIGDQVTLKCDVTGEPKPEVQWTKDGKLITANEKYTIFKDHSLRFMADLNDGGNYTCEATNHLGSDFKNITLNIYEPVKIEPPKDLQINPWVGTDLELTCEASGDPKPNIMWMYFTPNFKDNTILPYFNSAKMQLSKLQEESAGYYVCNADNGFSNESITYEVNVNVPVEIERPEKTEFVAVELDWVLKIPCKAKGYPKPTITWMVGELPLTIDTFEYNMDKNGTLIIYFPNNSTEKQYKCKAANSYSNDSELFNVTFSTYPVPSEPIETHYIEIGSTKIVKCDLPRSAGDTVHWYKNGTHVGTDDKLKLIDAVEADSGVYSCRVNSFDGSQSLHMKIIVGTKPSFLYEQKDIIFWYGKKLHLDCYANGVPAPKITWWHNDTKLSDENMMLEFISRKSDVGEKRCEANNEFGTITRSYVLKNTGCIIDYTEVDEHKYHPLLVTGIGLVNEFENENGVMMVPDKLSVTFMCPNKETTINCNNKEFVDVNKNITKYNYKDLKCDTEILPKILPRNEGEPCSSDKNSILFRVTYIIGSTFAGLYDVCYNKTSSKQIFVRHELGRYASDIENDSTKHFIKDYTSYNYDDMYRCGTKGYDKMCCFTGRQLVNARDLPPGLHKGTYFNINVIPQWNLCGNFHNWNEVEKRVRSLAKSIDYKLEIYSGEYENQGYLEDGYGHKISTSKYLWKVVQVRKARMALAIITINIANLTVDKARSLVFCKDIQCDTVDWMKYTKWRNVYYGYTFCCNAHQLAEKIDPHLQHIFDYKILRVENIK